MKIVVKIWDWLVERFTYLFESIADPFISAWVLYDETRRQNLDGSWDKYWEKKNRKMQ